MKLLWRRFIVPLLLLPLSVLAADKPDNLAEMWVITPKVGEAGKFEEALKRHVAYRKDKGDSREWRVYIPTLGNNLNYYVIRSCCSNWAEVDSYLAWQTKNKTGEHWRDNVSPLIASVGHNFAEVDMANSRWPEGDSGFQYFGVTRYSVKAGEGAGTEADKAALSENAKAMNWPYHWAWSWNVGGKPTLNLVVPYTNYAGMADPDPGFAASLAKHMGDEDKAKALLESWSSHFSGTEYQLYRLRMDLSLVKE
ncbi:hypothetical protein [Ferrimonas balearica]|uniref:hypothetical protein n=1 Tax=Ferrimonas balearica TaxID=44012 RepID=UPI001C9685DC|nr:hypothetical protein [Ferrimonas balearica]MBY5979591.1 hypothetical protein [Ferrimonas balearica]MBY6223543.1 hypothetical protein [Ferrimonas balearica]